MAYSFRSFFSIAIIVAICMFYVITINVFNLFFL